MQHPPSWFPPFLSINPAILLHSQQQNLSPQNLKLAFREFFRL